MAWHGHRARGRGPGGAHDPVDTATPRHRDTRSTTDCGNAWHALHELGATPTIESVWYPALRPALFALDPERAHALVLAGLRVAGRLPVRPPAAAPVELMGLRFPNRVGLAAGFDKNAIAVDGLGALGFGFIEVGTVTPRPQPGQPRPRLFRLPASGALVNRLGFPNDGADVVARRLRRRRYRGIVGVNIGKNATTPMERAVDDYVRCLRLVHDVADYIAVNVSSPNTAELRDLQARDRLEPLLTALIAERTRLATGRRLPLLLKIAPDLTSTELGDVAGLVSRLGVDGVIATNTTVSRAQLASDAKDEQGGVSGAPLRAAALRTVEALRRQLDPSIPIIGVGGIDSPQAALAMRGAGAELVEIYTGLVYRGPALVSRCVRALARRAPES
jgi:dihydroorotate dehydrogenase